MSVYIYTQYHELYNFTAALNSITIIIKKADSPLSQPKKPKTLKFKLFKSAPTEYL